MKYFIIALILFIISSCSGGGKSKADWDFDCTDKRAKIEINRKNSNILFTTTGLTTAVTAQYYFTTCITSGTTLGVNGMFSILSVPYLREEIVQGGGEYLQAWFQMIEIPKENHHVTILLLKQKYSTLDADNDLKFAQQIHQIVYDFNQFPLHKRVVFRRRRIQD